MYYEHAGQPWSYVYDWSGMPQQSVLAAESRGLGGYIETSEGADMLQELGEDFIDISARAHLRKALGDYPVSMSMEAATRSVRHSGAEQTQINDMRPALGFFGSLSNNEQRALVMMMVGGAGLLFWKMQKRRAR
jgi:hypothetical protein